VHGSWLRRRAVVHQSSSVLLVLSCNRFDRIQAATSFKQIDIRDCRALTSRGWQDPITWVSSANRWPCRPCCRTRSAVYSTNKMGPRTDPCGTPHRRWTIEDLVSPRRTCCVRPHRYDWNHLSAHLVTPYEISKRLSRTSWSTVSNAADRSCRTSAEKSPRSAAVRILDRTCRTAVSVELFIR